MTPVRFAAALLLALVLGFAEPGRAEVAVPPLTARVTDQTATLSAAQVASLEQTLAAFETRKGSQIAVLIVPTTQPEAIEQYGIRVVEQWRLGRKRVDDGALLIIAKDDHAVRIEVGYGLEGALNDAVCARIIREIITPKFRQGDFYGGITDGLARMIGVVDGEPLPPPPAPQAETGGSFGMQYLPILLIVDVIISGLLRALFGRLPAALLAGGGGGLLMWFFVGTLAAAIPVGLILFVFTLMGGFPAGRIVGGGGFGGFGGGFGGGGFSGGGGGFSGGGGGFGGGGASGSW